MEPTENPKPPQIRRRRLKQLLERPIQLHGLTVSAKKVDGSLVIEAVAEVPQDCHCSLTPPKAAG